MKDYSDFVSLTAMTRRAPAAGARPIWVPRRLRGVTLIELMIVVVIVGIIAAFAYPSYRNQVRDSRRTEARNALADVANRLERYIYQCNRYTNVFSDSQSACTGLGMIGGANVTTLNTENGYYRLTITIPGAAPFNTYTVTATPIGPQAKVDKECLTLTLNNMGVKGATGPNTSRCWK